MRSLITAAALAITVACSGSSVAEPASIAATVPITAPMEDTRLIAVISYASWCGSCKVLDPKISDVKSSNTFEGVEFFALDYSARDKDAFYTDAETLGISDTLSARFDGKVKTGLMFLIDTETGDIVSEITKDMDEAAITAAINAATATS
ncbi:MAG: thioredoxin domain-containing protein [Henriciella sp.]|nr:thioredoxin domain-containing protein [Henriciella sp.]